MSKIILIIITFIFCFMNKTKCEESYIIIHPEKQVAKLGSTITLQCRVKYMRRIQVHWLKNDFGIGSEINDIRQYGRPMNNTFRYDLPFNLQEGEYDLRITDLKLSDEGEFYCQMIVNGMGYSSKKAVVQILISSLEPKIFQNQREKSTTNSIIGNDGEFIVIDCIAKHGRPGAQLYWYINDMNIGAKSTQKINGTISGRITLSVTPSKENKKLYNSQSTMSINVKSHNHGTWIKCIAINQGFEHQKLRASMAQIEVHTIPIVTMTAYPNRKTNEYIENDVVDLSCTATGRPSVFTWKWYMNNKIVNNIFSSNYKVRLGRTIQRSTFTCVATSTRKGSASIKITMKYGPKFINENNLLYGASIGETVEMSCNVDSNPQSDISWRRESSTEVISRENNLRLTNIQEEDFGIYRCTAILKGFSSVFKNLHLAMKKKPLIRETFISYGRIGQSARLSCSIESVPLPKNNEIKWIFRNKVIPLGNRYKSYQEVFYAGVVTVLQILSLNVDDFGDYNCTVVTSLGSATKKVILVQKGGTPILMIIGTFILFIFILLMITVVLHISKNRKYKIAYKKGNHSSLEIPENHVGKSILIDSDCHNNPNLYSWIPQEINLKENKVLHTQDGNIWSRFNGMDSLRSFKREYTSNKPRSKYNHIRENPFYINYQNKSSETANLIKDSSLPQPLHKPFRQKIQRPHLIYQNYDPKSNAQIISNNQNKENPSSLYHIKNGRMNKRKFPIDYFATSQTLNSTKTTFSSNSTRNTLVSEYASNI